MRLLHRGSGGNIVHTRNFWDETPPYAILSHTWGAEEDEVSFDDVLQNSASNKVGYRKIQFCMQQAEKDDLEYIWVDTCCIKKTDSTELGEAITSMFRWYRDARKCYVYLSDVAASGDTGETWKYVFANSRWFQRGWTLQELLAPPVVEFFSRDGKYLGDRLSLQRSIFEITTIPLEALQGQSLFSFSIDEKLRWTKHRTTKRKEDRAYCLQGLFDVFIPLMYGEQDHAFVRLRKAIDERWPGKSGESRSRLDAQKRSWSEMEQEDNVDPAIQKLLAFPEMHNRRLGIESRHRNTCEWILEAPDYVKWSSQKRGLFWVQGKPGSGKSTLMAFLHGIMKDDQRRLKDNKIELDFFFTARGTELQRTIPGMLRSLLLQLFTQDVATKAQMRINYREKADTMGGLQENWEWQLTEIETMLTRSILLAARSRPVNVFVDALDEAGEDSARKMADFFHRLSEQGASTQAQLKICISCRHYPVVNIRAENCQVVVEEHNHHDIASFVRDNLQHINSSADEDWSSLIEELTDCANGVFQWAHLAVALVQRQMYRGLSLREVREVLRDVPTGLKDLYMFVLKNVIDQADRTFSSKLFRWTCLAKRPLTLQETYFALGLESTAVFNMKRRIGHLSGGLIEVVSVGADALDTVQVSHQSIADFMLAEGLATMIAWDRLLAADSRFRLRLNEPVQTSHATLYWSCIDNLSSWKGREVEPSVFGGYAAMNVFHHAELAGTNRSYVVGKEVATWQDLLPFWYKMHRNRVFARRHPSQHSTHLILVASEANMVDMVVHLLREGADVNTKDMLLRTALHFAVSRDHQDMARVLVKAGADVNAVDFDCLTPIIYSVLRGSESMIKWLFDSIEHSYRKTRAHSALYTAADIGRVDLVRLLLNAGAAIDEIGGVEGTALCAAATKGHTEVVRELIKRGANPDIEYSSGSAMAIAAWYGHGQIIQLLITSGADVNTRAGISGGALYRASAIGDVDVVQALIKAGADVEIPGGKHHTPLKVALQNGKHDVVEILIKAGAKPRTAIQGDQF